ncbi:bifunctional 2-polyprenyl-6-hydroxyphenol methylase/3-demethylubiquinol 3-O-methyltransferase UbiG [Micromonospora sp. AMSO31t]|uniref:class I SAM-dependent methyltransferase n=1 Tax=Micromonospora sp. AMSO31t TaxID=2650566 RepID=UPI00124AF87E|nr:class I SAM-dependent methyltransferase [Micromonospora sp. AMSO31t]KAB1911393.1 class I SAM-dependent methyltransferase [Micromonospora sp. AMSO31t]
MEATEIRKLAALEDTHWWYRERRVLLGRALRRLAAGARPGRALDIGAAGGGNTRVLRAHGWRPVALEYSAEGAGVARARGLHVIRADARHLPVPSAGLGLVVAFDILEHVDEDHVAAAEIRRALRPGGTALIAVPADMRLWSAHDVAVGHIRRYDRAGLRAVVEKAGLVVDELWSWNVLLRPVAAWRRRRSTGSNLDAPHPLVNLGLRTVVTAERHLPVRALPGVSLMLRAHRPA